MISQIYTNANQCYKILLLGAVFIDKSLDTILHIRILYKANKWLVVKPFF